MAFKKMFYILVLLKFVAALQVSTCCSHLKINQEKFILLKDLIIDLHKIHNFDNILLYINLSPRPQYDDATLLKSVNNVYKTDLVTMLVQHLFSGYLNTPLIIFNMHQQCINNNNNQAVINADFILNKQNLALVLFDDIFNMSLNEYVGLSLSACLEAKVIFYFVGHEHTLIGSRNLKKFFQWCWSKNILNVILLFQRNFQETEIYTYTPFPKPIKIIRLTLKQTNEYFQDRALNLKGYSFKSPVWPDKPLVFKTLDPFTGTDIISGISGKIYMEYTKHVNATFKELKSVKQQRSFMELFDHVYDLLSARKIDISIHPLIVSSYTKFFSSYPISNSNNCVVVPVKRDLFLGHYIPKALSSKMWLLLALIFLIFQMAYMLINHDIYGLTKPWSAFSITLKGLLSMPVENMSRYKTITKHSNAFQRKIFMHMLLLLTGMIFSQTHMAALSSFFSSNLYPQQIESLKDLSQANLSIMLTDYTLAGYKFLDLIPHNFSPNLFITDSATVSSHLNQLDTRYAYTVYNEEWKVIQHLQKGLVKPRFKIVSQLCIPNVYLHLPMQFNSPFYKSFKQFALSVQSSGLYVKWSDMIYWQIYKANNMHINMTENLERLAPLQLEHLTYVLYIYGGGMLMASVVFLLELKLASFRNKFKLFKIKRISY